MSSFWRSDFFGGLFFEGSNIDLTDIQPACGLRIVRKTKTQQKLGICYQGG